MQRDLPECAYWDETGLKFLDRDQGGSKMQQARDLSGSVTISNWLTLLPLDIVRQHIIQSSSALKAISLHFKELKLFIAVKTYKSGSITRMNLYGPKEKSRDL